MKLAYFDCQFGAAGDMLLAALLGAGVPEEAWLKELKKIALPADSFTVKIEQVVRSTLSSKRVAIEAAADDVEKHSERSLTDIFKIIERSEIRPNSKDLARSIFLRLAKAEGRVHGIPTEMVHFHEIGAIDSIVDIIGFAVGYAMLAIDRSIVSSLALGSGTVRTEHGILPVPAPAVLELIQEAQAPVRKFDCSQECLTPTAAAILAEVAASWGALPDLEKILAVGYGAGERNPKEFPNVCRVLIGESIEPTDRRFSSESISVLETNLDDLSPQILSFTAEDLTKQGALDVFVTPCLMKKGRSGHLLTVLCRPADSLRLQEEILLKTSTLGVRRYDTQRLVAQREWQTVQLDGSQPVRIKIARDQSGKALHAQPEYEDCAAHAWRSGLALEEVFRQALAKYHQS